MWAHRWFQATKSNNQAMAAKVDSLKDEMDEALNKVEICKVYYVWNDTFQPGPPGQVRITSHELPTREAL